MGKGRRDRLRDECARRAWNDDREDRGSQKLNSSHVSSRGEAKDRQLERTVWREVEHSLLALPPNVLRHASAFLVVGVEVRGGSHAAVVVTAEVDMPLWPVAAEWLEQRANAVRSELARTLQRKRTPTVSIHFLPSPPPAAQKES